MFVTMRGAEADWARWASTFTLLPLGAEVGVLATAFDLGVRILSPVVLPHLG